jgi:excisionase family DNA binding protein
MMPNTSPDAPVLTLKEASQFLGLSIPTLYRLGKKGDIELIRVGERGTRVTKVSLDRYLKNAKRVK